MTFNAENDDKLWELYLHKVHTDMSFEDFKRSISADPRVHDITPFDVGATVNKTFDMLKNFEPERG